MRSLQQQQDDFFLTKYFKISHDNGATSHSNTSLIAPATRTPLGMLQAASIGRKASQMGSQGVITTMLF